MPAIPATHLADIDIRSCHDATTGERITHIRHLTTTVRILDRHNAQPVCMVVPSQVGKPCVIQALPWSMSHDDAIAYWALRLLGHVTTPDQIAIAREYLDAEVA